MIKNSALRQRAARALLWSALRSALLSVASPLLTLALTRWLAPADFGTGRDAQLMKALEVRKKKIKDEPRPGPRHEAFAVDR